MNNKVLKTLEFDKILERLSQYTESPSVKKRIEELVPYPTLDLAKEAQRETTEAVITSLKLGGPPVNLSVGEVTKYVRLAERSGMLHAKELMEISRMLYVARRMKSYLDEAAEECHKLHEICENIQTAKALEDRINLCIVSEEEIADEASSELSTIRRKMRNLNAKIKDTLNGILSKHTGKSLEEVVQNTERDNFMTSQEALDFGLIDRVITNRSEITASDKED